MSEVYGLVSSPSDKLLFVDFGINKIFFVWLKLTVADLLRAERREKI